MDSGDEFVVRAYAPEDKDRLLALAPRLAEGVPPWRDPAAVLASVLDWVRSSADSATQDGHAVFVATLHAQVVGFVTVTERKHYTGQLDGYVGELVTAPGHERRGIATRLMAAAEQWTAGRGLACLTLDTGAAMDVARAFYAALGFCEEDVKLTKNLRRPDP